MAEIIVIDSSDTESDDSPSLTRPPVQQLTNVGEGNKPSLSRVPVVSSVTLPSGFRASVRGGNVGRVPPRVRNQPNPATATVIQPVQQLVTPSAPKGEPEVFVASVNQPTSLYEIRGEDGYTYSLNRTTNSAAATAAQSKPTATSNYRTSTSDNRIARHSAGQTQPNNKVVSTTPSMPITRMPATSQYFAPRSQIGQTQPNTKFVSTPSMSITRMPATSQCLAPRSQIGQTQPNYKVVSTTPSMTILRMPATSQCFAPRSQIATPTVFTNRNSASITRLASPTVPAARAPAPAAGCSQVSAPVVRKVSGDCKAESILHQTKSDSLTSNVQTSTFAQHATAASIVKGCRGRWSEESLKAMDALLAMRDNVKPVKREPEPTPSPSKVQLGIENFRRRRAFPEPVAAVKVKVEMIDLSEDDLPDLDSCEILHESFKKRDSVCMETAFQRTGNSIARCLQSLATPPRSIRPSASVSSTPGKSSVLGKRAYNQIEKDDGSDDSVTSAKSISIARSADSKVKVATKPVAEKSMARRPSEQVIPPLVKFDVKTNLNDSVIVLDDSLLDDSLTLIESNDNLINDVVMIESTIDDSSLHSTKMDPIVEEAPAKLRASKVGLRCKSRAIVAPPAVAVANVAPKVLNHRNISPNGGAEIKATAAVIAWDVRRSLLGNIKQVATPDGKDELFDACSDNLIRTYFASADEHPEHAAHGLQLLAKLSDGQRRPEQWAVSKLLEYMQCECSVDEEYDGPGLRDVIGYFRQLNGSGQLVGERGYDFPLWNLLQSAAGGLEKSATVTVTQSEVVKFVRFVMEEEIALLARPNCTATGKSCTSKHLSPDTNFLRLMKIQNWIVGGLIVADDWLVQDMLHDLSRILALALCVAQDCESAALRLAEGFCTSYRQLHDSRLRRRFITYVAPRLVHVFFLQLLLDCSGDASTVPPAVVQKYSGCKLCVRKVIKYYFRMDGLVNLPSADQLNCSFQEFLLVLTALLEAYVLLLMDWRRAWLILEIGDAHHRNPIERELRRLKKMGRFVSILEDRLGTTPETGCDVPFANAERLKWIVSLDYV